MHLFFFLKTENFGDGVNERFFNELTNNKILKHNIKNVNNINVDHYISTGSIMCLVNNNSIIYGTGFISENGDLGGGNFLSTDNKIKCIPKHIISVRGPLTRKKLLNNNIKCPDIYGDPLILFPCIYPFYTNVKDNIIGIIPHYIDKKHENLTKLINNLKKKNYNVIVIDICIGDKYEKLIDNINKCKCIISSSLHGIIMGLNYKKKTIFLEFSDRVIGNRFKFNDYFKSLNIDFDYKNDFTENILSNIIKLDYKNLYNQGNKLIQITPFIEDNRKIELINIYKKFYEDVI